MAFYREEETRSAIENFVRWNGDGASVRSAASIWGILRSELMRPTGPAIPAIGTEAGRTEKALERIGERASRALVLYHGSPYMVRTMAAALGVARSTFYVILENAHVAYWEALDAISLQIRQAAATADRARAWHEAATSRASTPLTKPSSGLRPLPRRRRASK
jgi:hypothetical protein